MNCQNQVLLGVLDQPIKGSQVSWDVNKIGGEPTSFPNTTFEELDIQCKVCTANQVHVCQLYCPLEHSVYHRILNLFACINKQCWNKSDSWCVMRTQFPVKAKERNACKEDETTEKDLGDSWGVNENDWGVDEDNWGVSDTCDKTNFAEMQNKYDSSTERHASNHTKNSEDADYLGVSSEDVLDSKSLEQQMDDLNIGNIEEQKDVIVEDIAQVGDYMYDILDTRKPNHSEESVQTIQANPGNCVILDAYYINVIEELNTDETTSKHEELLMTEYSRREGVRLEDMMNHTGNKDNKKKSGGSESYEKTSVKHGDHHFHKFLKRVSQHPQQILRYEWSGKPLLMSAQPLQVAPPCKHCGSERVFELQIMPSLVSSLRSSSDPDATLLEFGTVEIYSCSKSCWDVDNSSPRSEYVFLEPDPDAQLFR